MKVSQIRGHLKAEYFKVLYFIEKYLLDEYQLVAEEEGYTGFIVLFQDGNEENEPYQLAKEVMKSEVGLNVMKDFGYVIMSQDQRDIIIKNIY